MSDCKKTSRKATLYTNCEDFIKAQHINLYHYLLYSTTVNTVWFLDTISSDFLHTPEQKQSPHVAARFFFIYTHTTTHTHTGTHKQTTSQHETTIPDFIICQIGNNEAPRFHKTCYNTATRRPTLVITPCFNHTAWRTQTHAHTGSSENLIKVGSPWQPVSLFIYLFISVNTRSLYSGNVKRGIISSTWLPNWALIEMKSVARAETLRIKRVGVSSLTINHRRARH